MDVPKDAARRRFVRLMAASGAALLAGPLAQAAPARSRRAPPAGLPTRGRALSPAIRAEIESQKRGLAATLKVIRDFELPPGSPPAFVFRARRARVRR